MWFVEFKLSSKSLCYVEFTQNCKGMCYVEFTQKYVLCWVHTKVCVMLSSHKTVKVCVLLETI